MQAAKKIATNTGILYLRMAITIFISLYTTRLILTALGTSDFGIFSIVAGSIAMLTFLNTAMAAATQRFMSYAQGAGEFEKLKSIFTVSVILHLLIAIFIFILLEVVGYFLFEGILKISEARLGAAKMIFQFAVASTLFTIISVPYDAVINAHENMMQYAILGIIESVCKLAIAFYVTYTTFDRLEAYGFLMAVLSILLLIINRIYCHKKYAECEFNIKRYFNKKLFKEMAGFGGWSFLGSMAGMLSNYGQGIVLNIFFGTAVNAAQGIANQISGQIGAFSGAMLKALNPVIVKSEGGGNRSQMIKSSMTGSKLSYFLYSFLAIPAIIEMPFILSKWLTAVPDSAVIFCRLLLIKTLIEQLFVTLSVSISAVGKIKHFQITLSILAIFPLLVSYVLFKIGFSPSIMYIVFIIQCIIRSFGIILYYAWKYTGLPVSIFLKDVVLRCVSVTLLTYLLAIILVSNMDEGFLRFLVLAILNVVVFLIAANWIGLIKEERDQIKLIINFVFNKLNIFKFSFR